MISPLMVSSKNVKVSQKRCLETFIESFTDLSLSEQIIKESKNLKWSFESQTISFESQGIYISNYVASNGITD